MASVLQATGRACLSGKLAGYAGRLSSPPSAVGRVRRFGAVARLRRAARRARLRAPDLHLPARLLSGERRDRLCVRRPPPRQGPQIAVWVESADGARFVDTLLVT